jgi:hypothetical protein
LIVDLASRNGYIPPETRVGMAMIHGVLALHLTHGRGDALVLLRAFVRDGVDPWIRRCEEPSTPGQVAEVPFDPMLLPGGRFLAFSRPSRLMVLDLWGCAGLSASEEVPPEVIEFREAPLAAPPIPLAGPTLGLLIGDANSGYRWRVWSVESPALEAENLAEAPSLPIEGTPCQAEVVDGRVLALATPMGHWVWGLEDATSARVGGLKQTWPPEGTPSDRQLVLDQQVLDRPDFREPRHVLRVNHRGRSQRFDWYALVQGRARSGTAEWVEHYSVSFATLEATRSGPIRSGPGSSSAAGRVIPIGTTRTTSEAAHVLFREGNQLRHERDGDASHWLNVPVDGVQWFDPMLVQVRTIEDGTRSIEVVPLGYPDYLAQVVIDEMLVADPVLWSRWLFTAERDDQGRVRIWRREMIDPTRAATSAHPGG